MEAGGSVVESQLQLHEFGLHEMPCQNRNPPVPYRIVFKSITVNRRRRLLVCWFLCVSVCGQYSVLIPLYCESVRVVCQFSHHVGPRVDM